MRDYFSTGSKIDGIGFAMSPDEYFDYVKRDKRNAEPTFPFIGGSAVNSSPTQSFDRYVINFSQMTLDEAEAWPDLMERVREKVKPQRDRLRDTAIGKRMK